jgi:hypothetical protein
MPDIAKLQELIRRQSELAGELAGQAAAYSDDIILNELNALKAENTELKAQAAENERARKTLTEENRSLRETLDAQLHAERSRFMAHSDARMAAYFGYDAATGRNALSAMEAAARKRFIEIRGVLDKESIELKERFTGRLDALETEIGAEIAFLQKTYSELGDKAADTHRAHVGILGESPVSEETEARVIRESQNKAERVVGLSVLGKVGAVIIIVGMIALAQLVYTYFTDIVKCLFMFGVATAILGFALFLNRKKSKRTPFTITILSLGVALEYTALSISYFTLTILNVFAALGICVAITAIAYTISLKLKNEVVAIFAQVGGYLPLIAIFTDMNLVYGAMVYFLVLNVLGFLLSAKYKWQILNFIAFGFNIVAVILVAIGVAVMTYLDPFGVAQGLTLLFMFFSFALHVMLPLLTNIRIKTKFNKADFILMTPATTLGLILFYVMFEVYGIDAYTGWLSVGFAAFYFGLYAIARAFFKTDTAVRTLFWLTGIVFLALFVPMHFRELAWFSFGWILEAAVLIGCALAYGKKIMFWTGVGVASLAGGAFLFLDVLMYENLIGGTDVFIYKYLMLTLASIAVLTVALVKKNARLGVRGKGRDAVYIDGKMSAAQVYAAVVYVNLAAFLCYALWKIFDASAGGEVVGQNGNLRFLLFALMISVIAAMAVVVPKTLKLLSIRRASFALHIAAFIFLIVVNSIPLPAFRENVLQSKLTALAFGGNSVGERTAAAFMLVLLTGGMGYVFYDLYVSVAALVKTKNLRAGLILALSSYFLLWFTHLMLVQFRLKFTNLAFGLVYMAVALTCLILGLYLKSAMTRRFALSVAGAAIFKLFVIDSFGLELVYRIVCYFVFGAVLIGMSFLYQLFYKKFAQPTGNPAALPDPESKKRKHKEKK